MTIGDYVLLLRRNAVLLVALLLVGLALSAAYALVQQPAYRSTTQVFVSVSENGNSADLSQGATFTQEAVKSYATVATSAFVLDSVIEQLHLRATAASLAAHVTAEATDSTAVLDISATDASPRRSAEIANAVARQLSEAVAILTPSGSGATSPVKLTIIGPAALPVSPVSPVLGFDLALGAAVGLAVALIIAALRRALDTRLRTEGDVRVATDLPVLGALTFASDARDAPLVVRTRPSGLDAEAYRTLRTNLHFLDLGGSKSFVITSSLPDEGKTTAAANLGLVMADADLNVLVVDADLRRPTLSDVLAVDGAIGLSDVLVGDVSLEEAIQPWGERNLAVLPAGSIPPNPSEMLQSTGMAELVAMLERRYDIVLIDAPPLLPVSDAAILSRLTAGAVVICSAEKARRQHLLASIAGLHAVGARVLGIVITMQRIRERARYGYLSYEKPVRTKWANRSEGVWSP